MLETQWTLSGYRRILIQQEPRECWAAAYGMLLRWADPGLAKEAALARVKERFAVAGIDVAQAENRGLIPSDWPRAALSLRMVPMAGEFVPAIQGQYCLKVRSTPVLCHISVRSGGTRYLHVVVVVGFDDKDVLFLDPEASNSQGTGKWSHDVWHRAAQSAIGAWVPCWV